MRNLNKKIEEYKCYWLKDYLKELIKDKDLKTYNRVKCVLYYFPDAFKSVSLDDIRVAMKYCEDTYVCIGSEDIRYPMFDKIYKDRHGKDFDAPLWGEARYVTIGEICECFGI